MEDIKSMELNEAIPEVEENKKAVKRVNFNMDGFNTYGMLEAFKTLKINLMFCGDSIKTILVTSTVENEGKSTISAKLAKSLAESGKKAVLLDADMRKSEFLKDANEIVGLSELLSGKCELENVIYKTQDDNFDVIFAGRYSDMSVELLEGSALKNTLEVLKESYDYVIIDTPPIGMVIDAAVIAPLCDGAIFVISDCKTRRRLAREAKRQLENSGCRILGVVLNSTEKSTKTYEYKYYKKNGYYDYGIKNQGETK